MFLELCITLGRNKRAESLFVVLSSQFSVLVCDVDVELFCTFNDCLSLLGRNCVGDFSTENAIVHHKNFQFSNIVDDKFFEIFLVLKYL